MPRTFLRELKRRRVYRVAVAYAIVGWLLIQIATQVFPFFHIPDWSVRLLVLLVLAGFPVALVLAWAFDATPHGIVRTTTEDQPVMRRARHGTLAVAAIGALLAVLAGGGYWWWHRGSAPAHPIATAAPAPAIIPEKSIAVLPLTNESGDKDQQYFSDGLSEGLITALSQFAGLKVINRDSSFRFRDSKDDIKTIGAKLGVANLLEGSVQRAGDMVRISAELVNATDGSTLWSQRYDRPYKDLFALQDDITSTVAGELKAKLLTSDGAVAQSDRPASGNLEAYNAWLQGNFYVKRFTEPDLRKAAAQYTAATRIDPRYATAWASLSQASALLAGEFLDGGQAQQTNAQARKAADTALALEPNLAAAHVARGYVLFEIDFDWHGAEAEYRRALQLAPDNEDASLGMGSVLAALGQPRQALAQTTRALAIDPLSARNHIHLAEQLAALGRLDEALQAISQGIELNPGATNTHSALANLEIQRGDAKAALAAAQEEVPGVWQTIALALARQIGGDRAAADAALMNLIDRDSNGSAYQIAVVYALRRDPDNLFKWLDRAWVNRDPGIQFLLTDPLLLRYKNDPRFAAFCRKVGLPAPNTIPTQPSP